MPCTVQLVRVFSQQQLFFPSQLNSDEYRSSRLSVWKTHASPPGPFEQPALTVLSPRRAAPLAVRTGRCGLSASRPFRPSDRTSAASRSAVRSAAKAAAFCSAPIGAASEGMRSGAAAAGWSGLSARSFASPAASAAEKTGSPEWRSPAGPASPPSTAWWSGWSAGSAAFQAPGAESQNRSPITLPAALRCAKPVALEVI